MENDDNPSFDEEEMELITKKISKYFQNKNYSSGSRRERYNRRDSRAGKKNKYSNEENEKH